MRLSRVFLILLIPLVTASLGAWLFAATKKASGVKVAGEVVGTSKLKIEVLDVRELNTPAGKRYRVKLEIRNAGGNEVHVNPYGFQMVVSRSLVGTGSSAFSQSFIPMLATSRCEDALDSFTRIPEGSRRQIELIFWGDNVPNNWKEEGYVFGLDYFDEEYSVAFSRIISPI